MALGYGRVGTNNFSTHKFIVDGNGIQNGATHSTIASAISDASSGDTIFIREGTYTEDFTAKSGVKLEGAKSNNIDAIPPVTIIGKITGQASGSFSIYNLTLQTNSDYIIEVTGSNAPSFSLFGCRILATNNTAFFYNTTGLGVLTLTNCAGNLSTTGICYFNFTTSTSGVFNAFNCFFDNSGMSTTSNTFSCLDCRINYTYLNGPISTSGSTNFKFHYSEFYTEDTNTLAITHGGTGLNSEVEHCIIRSGSAASISVSASTTLLLTQTQIDSTNSNPITGSGTVKSSGLTFTSSGYQINTTTKTFGKTLGQYNLISTATASSSASIVFTDLTSSYREYQVYCENLIGATAGTVTLEFSTDGGSTWVSTGYYQYKLFGDIIAGAQAVTYQNNAANYSVANYISGGTYITNIFIRFFNHASSQNKHVYSNWTFENATQRGAGYTSGLLDITSAINAIRLVNTGGNIASGDFYLYGVLA